MEWRFAHALAALALSIVAIGCAELEAEQLGEHPEPSLHSEAREVRGAVAVPLPGDAAGAYCDIAVDSQDRRHLLIRERSHSRLWYIGPGAERVIVDQPGFGTGTHVGDEFELVVAPDGGVHVVYLGDGDRVWYAERTADGWAREDLGRMSRWSENTIAIAYDRRRGSPVIGFRPWGGNAAVFERGDGGGWQNHGIAGVVSLVDIAVDQDGVTWVSGFKDKEHHASDRLAAWRVDHSAALMAEFSSYEHDRAPFALYPDGTPILFSHESIHRFDSALVEWQEFSGPERFSLSYWDATFGERPHYILKHGGQWEFVTTDSATNAWQYTVVAAAEQNDWPNIAADSFDRPHACFRCGSDICVAQ